MPLIDDRYKDEPGRNNTNYVYNSPALTYIRELHKTIEASILRESEEQAIPVITNENFVNPPPGIDIVGLKESEAYQKSLALQDAAWEKNPVAGKQYYLWLIDRIQLEKDNYELAYKKYGLDKVKIANYYAELNCAVNRLKAMENFIESGSAPVESKLQNISSDYLLDYYTDKVVIPNQELVQATIDHFQNGPGSRAFQPLEFLNLLDKQNTFVKFHFQNRTEVMEHLQELDLATEERHILYGLY